MPTKNARDAAGDRPTGRRLFGNFFRLGLTAFGGPAMLVHIRDFVVDEKRWLSRDDFATGLALCQTLPGATSLQIAAYAGLRLRGPAGALAAFAGFCLPAFFLMLGLAVLYQTGKSAAELAAVFAGMRIVVIAIIASAVFGFGREIVRGWRDLFLVVAAAAFLLSGGNPVLAILLSALFGVLLYRSGREPAGSVAAGPLADRQRVLRFVGIVVAIVLPGMCALSFVDSGLFDLSADMMKISALSFGGGFAAVPMMLHEAVEVHGWMDSRTFIDGMALGQITPGPVVITATFIGQLVAGPAGAVVATVAIFLPSFVLLLLAVPWFGLLSRRRWFRGALAGILASFVGLLLSVGIGFAGALDWTVPAVLLALAAFVALRFKVDIIWVVAAGMLLSVVAS